MILSSIDVDKPLLIYLYDTLGEKFSYQSYLIAMWVYELFNL